jgi:hypothetical protein
MYFGSCPWCPGAGLLVPGLWLCGGVGDDAHHAQVGLQLLLVRISRQPSQDFLLQFGYMYIHTYVSSSGQLLFFPIGQWVL